MSELQDLIQENKDLRKQLITLSRCIRDIQDCAVDDDISIELRVLLASVPVSYLSHPLYPK